MNAMHMARRSARDAGTTRASHAPGPGDFVADAQPDALSVYVTDDARSS